MVSVAQYKAFVLVSLCSYHVSPAHNAVSQMYSKCSVKIWFNAIRYAEERPQTRTFVIKRNHTITVECDIAKNETALNRSSRNSHVNFHSDTSGVDGEPLSMSGNTMKDVDYLTARQLFQLLQCNLYTTLPCASPFCNESPYFFGFPSAYQMALNQISAKHLEYIRLTAL